VLCTTSDGFVVAERDLELRGPGDIEGTRQSGALQFRLADILADRPLLEAARERATQLLDQDPGLQSPEHDALRRHLRAAGAGNAWSRIS